MSTEKESKEKSINNSSEATQELDTTVETDTKPAKKKAVAAKKSTAAKVAKTAKSATKSVSKKVTAKKSAASSASTVKTDEGADVDSEVKEKPAKKSTSVKKAAKPAAKSKPKASKKSSASSDNASDSESISTSSKADKTQAKDATSKKFKHLLVSIGKSERSRKSLEQYHQLVGDGDIENDLLQGIQFYGTGRRKEATARVFMSVGSGQKIVNGKPIEHYFPRIASCTIAQQALVHTGNADIFDIYATISGGGENGQAIAFRMGCARALLAYDQKLKQSLREQEMLTRDARQVERKKPGLRKARRARQYSKR